MRITRSISLRLKVAGIYSVKRSGLLVSFAAILIISAMIGQNFLTRPMTASAVTPPDSCFDFDSGTGAIVNYYNNEGNNTANPACPRDVDIPATINGVNVTKIGDNAFIGNHLTSVAIPSSVASIGLNAFQYNDLSVLPAYFSNSAVTVIPANIFSSNKFTSLTIPSNITEIQEYAFSDNFITTLSIPSSVTTLGNFAFDNNEISTLTIGAYAASMSDTAFTSNPIVSATIDGVVHVPATGTTPESCFSFNSGSHTITGYKTNSLSLMKNQNSACLSVLDIPSTIGGVPVTSIQFYTFFKDKITELTLPSTLTDIGIAAFGGNRFSHVTIPALVSSIGPGAFSQGRLDSLTVLGSNISLGNSVFHDNLFTTLPAYFGSSSVTNIPDNTFSSNRLVSLTIPDNITSIGGAAFAHNQIADLTLNDHITDIGNSAFRGNKITSVVIPDNVTTLGDKALSYNRLTSLTLGKGITSIGDWTFGANSLTEVTIPTNITSIFSSAFVEQNPIGGGIELDEDSPIFMWSDDPAIVRAAYDSIWYVRLRLEDPSNPHNIHDGIIGENWYLGKDVNENGRDDSIGGHLINATSVTLNYVDEKGNSVKPRDVLTGQMIDGTFMTDYMIKNSPPVTPPADLYDITPEEYATIDQELSAYYRYGDNFSYNAPSVSGRSPTPTSYSFVLGTSNIINSKTFVYGAAATSPIGGGGQLANTGLDEQFVAVGALVLVIGSLGLLVRKSL